MRKREKVLKDYTFPLITVEEINLEKGIAQSSYELKPGDETGVIQVSEWDQEADIPSIEGDSRW